MGWGNLGIGTPPPPDPCKACGYVEGDPLPAGLILKQAREAAGLSMVELLDRAGVDWESWQLAKLEARKRVTYTDEWEALCTALGLDPTKTAKGETS